MKGYYWMCKFPRYSFSNHHPPPSYLTVGKRSLAKMIYEAILFSIPIFIAVFIFYILYVTIRGGTPKIVRYDEEKFYEAADGKHPLPSIHDEATVDLSVIVPAYNEEKRLPVMLEETIDFLQHKQKSSKFDYKYEIIVVDDGSKDETSKVAVTYSEKYGPEKVRIIRLVKNRGKGGAVRIGMMSARGKYLLMADADGATKFADYDKVKEKLDDINTLKHGMAISVGSRAHLEEESIASRSFFRTVLMKGFHLLVWLLCVRSVNDSQCGFKLLTRPAVISTFLNLHVERWAFDVELLYIAEQLNIPVTEVAVRWTEIEGSKIVPVFSWIQMGKDILLIWLHYQLRVWKIKKYID